MWNNNWKKGEDYDPGDFVILDSKEFQGEKTKFICQKQLEHATTSPLVDIFLPSKELYGAWFEERLTHSEVKHMGHEYSAALGSKEEEKEAKELDAQIANEKKRRRRSKSRKRTNAHTFALKPSLSKRIVLSNFALRKNVVGPILEEMN